MNRSHAAACPAIVFADVLGYKRPVFPSPFSGLQRQSNNQWSKP
ncbi:MAG: hypothetical protein GMKNLPBB_02584 [Myxococcota bacterium]|nr:hypothetical protein [Myxococcota bacterium]